MLRFSRRALDVARSLCPPALGMTRGISPPETQRLIDDALNAPEPITSADSAFHQGLGFQQLAEKEMEFNSLAIKAFQIAVELNPAYRASAEKCMAACYFALGDHVKAYNLLDADFQRVALGEDVSGEERKILRKMVQEELEAHYLPKQGYSMAV